MKILLTGHRGYIGSVAGEMLGSAGHEVVGAVVVALVGVLQRGLVQLELLNELGAPVVGLNRAATAVVAAVAAEQIGLGWHVTPPGYGPAQAGHPLRGGDLRPFPGGKLAVVGRVAGV